MTSPYFIEILARNGDVLNRHKVQSLPIRIGRGYDNDVILDDAHSAASHAIVDLDENGKLLLRDLGSKNGTFAHGKRADGAGIVVEGNTVVRLGHTRLRIRSADFPVPAEVADTTMHGWEGTVPASIGLALIAVFSCLGTWISDIEPFALIRYLLVLASSLGLGLLWAGAWGLANRLFGSHARMGRHLFILGSGMAAVFIWRALSNVIAYAWSAEVFTRYGSLVTLAIVCAMLFFHLITIKPHHPRRFAITAWVMLVVGSALSLLNNAQSTGRTSDELYMSVLLPPEVRQSPDRNLEQFLTNAAKLKEGADAARARSVRDGFGDGDDDSDGEVTD
ncbi:FHA domain-containing protein [Duganella sp. FT27W]|uniref:FHA domain-containing protein n=1 Tax=Duganella sp. FT27W TaxID=2654636 RepID=UPI00128BC2FA|nr:FHA domain-containing protein [Duganella sp. FT27W]MPQ58080.1 FHA domain-containing protein [Duganella sp. FT27W]